MRIMCTYFGSRDEEDELLKLFSGDAEIEIKKAFLNDNNLIGKTITLDLTASDVYQ